MTIRDSYADRLPQYVADGEPKTPETAALRRHLLSCSSCQAERLRLRWVEQELRALPVAAANPALPQRIMRAVAQQTPPVLQERWLTWDLWVPALTLLLAAFCLLTLVPPQTLPQVPLPEMDRYLIEQHVQISELIKPSGSDVSLSLALWSAVFAILAGLGLLIGLRSWTTEHTRSLNDLEQQVSGAAQRLLHLARRFR